MKLKKRGLLLLLSVILCSMQGGCDRSANLSVIPEKQAETRFITDMGNRRVAIPKKITKVFCSNPIGTADLYMLAPDRLAGWNFKPSKEDRQFIHEKYLDLPALGVWMGAGATPNTEEIAKVAPDLIFCFWSTDQSGIEMADTIQVQTGLPVVLMDYQIGATDKVFKLLGEYLEEEERAELLSEYCREKLDFLKEKTGDIPEHRRKKVFISQGRGGLQTDPVGSLHVQDVMDWLKLTNVADLPGTAGKGMGMPTVSVEQLMIWEPDVILVNEYNLSDTAKSDLYTEIRTNPALASLKAVTDKRVFDIPQSPFSWLGKPPSAGRILGSLWLAGLLYPDETDIDIKKEAKDFYKLFYQYSLTQEQMDKLLLKAQ